MKIKTQNCIALVFFSTTLVLSGFAKAKTGKEVYNGKCAVCHANGIAGAPKKGDAAAWLERLATGKDVVYMNAIKGKKAMPPKGTCGSCSDEEVKAAVDYLISDK